jgi:hypothetical protein
VACWYSCCWPGAKPRGDVRPRRGHKSLRALLDGGRRTGVHGDVPLPRVHVRHPWWRTLAIVVVGVVGSYSGAVGVVTNRGF